MHAYYNVRYKDNLLGAISLIKEEYTTMVEKKFKSGYDEIVMNFEGYVKVIEKLEKVEKVDKLQKSSRQLIEDLSSYLKDMKGQQPDILDTVIIFSNHIYSKIRSTKVNPL